MQGSKTIKALGAGVAALVAMFALWGALFATQTAYAAENVDLAAGTIAVDEQSQAPKIVADDKVVTVAKSISIKAQNNTKGQTGTWMWEATKGAGNVKLTNTSKQTVKVKGVKGGDATLKVTFITDSGKKASTTVKVKVNGIKNKVVATGKYVKGIVFKRTGVNTVRVESTKGNKDVKLTTIKIPNTIKLGDAKGHTATYKVTAIKAGALNNQKKTTKIIVGNNVKTIGAHAFCSDPKLKTLTLGTGVTKLGANVIHVNNKALKTITIKSTKLKKASVKSCFRGNKFLKTVKVPASKKAAYKKIFTKKNCGIKVTVK